MVVRIIVKRGDMNEPPKAIQILVPTLGAQQVPGTAGSQVLASGSHCIQGTAALIIVVIFMDTMIHQTNLLVTPVVSLKRVTANAVLVQPMEVMVNVARLLMIIMNLE